MEISIVDDRGQTRAPREAGEIVVKTPSLMNGYFGDPARTQSVIRNGLCHTGDIGYVDQRGFLYCLGRKDRQFKLGGRMVNPSLIEQCIASHPFVREVTVAKSENGQEEWICARVKTRETPKENLPEELRKFCRKRMADYLVPGEFRFENGVHYYHKGKVFSPAKDTHRQMSTLVSPVSGSSDPLKILVAQSTEFCSLTDPRFPAVLW